MWIIYLADGPHKMSSLFVLWKLRKYHEFIIFWICPYSAINRIYKRLTLILLKPDMSYICKQFRSRSVGFFISQLISICIPASVTQLDEHPTGDRGCRFDPCRVGNILLRRFDHEIFSTVILSFLLIQEGQWSVSVERVSTILVNRLEDWACPVKVWLGKLMALNMTPFGWLSPKHKQTSGSAQGLIFGFVSIFRVPHLVMTQQ